MCKCRSFSILYFGILSGIYLTVISTEQYENNKLEQAMAHLADKLGKKERDVVFKKGAKMSLDDAVDLALA